MYWIVSTALGDRLEKLGITSEKDDVIHKSKLEEGETLAEICGTQDPILYLWDNPETIQILWDNLKDFETTWRILLGMKPTRISSRR